MAIRPKTHYIEHMIYNLLLRDMRIMFEEGTNLLWDLLDILVVPGERPWIFGFPELSVHLRKNERPSSQTGQNWVMIESGKYCATRGY